MNRQQIYAPLPERILAAFTASKTGEVMKLLLLAYILTGAFFPLSLAFVVAPSTTKNTRVSPGCFRRAFQPSNRASAPLLAKAPGNNKKSGLDESVRTKLVTESIAPWRTLRLFLYGSLGSGAFIGGLVTLTSIAAISSGAKEGDLNTELMNLAINFGAVAAFAFLVKWDLDNQAKLNEKVEERMEKKKEYKMMEKEIKAREKQLGSLRLDVQVSADGSTKDASVSELQAGARQHMIIVIGPKKACRDALVGANLLKMDFAMSNILVVPYEIGLNAAEQRSRPEGTGFGDRPIYERQAYIARPFGEGWDEYVEAELADAVKQNGDKVKEEGIAIVVSSNGKVIRRGVGKVPWRQMVEQLDESIGGGREKEPSLF